jgi:hypothetical protein
MKSLQYIIFIWLIGILVSPVFLYVLMGMKNDFFEIYLMLVLFGGMFSFLTEVVLIGIYFLFIAPYFKTVFQVKFATNITVFILTILTFIIIFSNTNLFETNALILISPYVITMSIAVWGLKLNIEKKENISFDDDDDVL